MNQLNIKKIFATTLAMGLASWSLCAQNISVTEIEAERSADEVRVSFRADIDRRATRGGRTFIVVPVMRSGADRQWLPAIIVEGRRARVANKRHEWVAGPATVRSAIAPDAIVVRRGSRVEYSVTTPWQEWMANAGLVAETIAVGCCSTEKAQQVSLSGDLALASKPEVQPEPAMQQPEPTFKPIITPELKYTTAELLAQKYPYIAPYSAFLALPRGRVFDEERRQSLIVYFHQAKHNIDTDFLGNETALVDLVEVIRTIETSADSRVKRVVIAGFASPEGATSFNERLAQNRAQEVKTYLLRRTTAPEETIVIHNGGEDWNGLRELVLASDMALKDKIVEIIDTVPLWDPATRRGREGVLMNLDGGRPYKYMYDNLFPALRNAAYIKIYYENQ